MLKQIRAKGFELWADVRAVGLLTLLAAKGYQPKQHDLRCEVYRYGVGDSYKALAMWRQANSLEYPVVGSATLYIGREKFARAIADRLNEMGTAIFT